MRRAKRQMVMKLTRREALRALWNSLAELSRRELVEQYAKLIGRAARAELQDERQNTMQSKGGDDERR